MVILKHVDRFGLDRLSLYFYFFFRHKFPASQLNKNKDFPWLSGKGAISIPKKSRSILPGSLSSILLLFRCGYFTVF